MPEPFHNFQEVNWRCRQYLRKGEREQDRDQRGRRRDQEEKSEGREKKRREGVEPEELCAGLGDRSHHAVC